jgi:hypothetical protein
VTNSDIEVQQPEPEVGSSRLLERSVDQEESLGFPLPKPSSVAVDQEAFYYDGPYSEIFLINLTK